jgi:hypothetical protein
MKTKLFPALLFLIILSSCGPAAEDRKMMHMRAKVFQDSIANALKAAIAEAEVPANTAVNVDTAALRARNATQQVPQGQGGNNSHAGHNH